MNPPEQGTLFQAPAGEQPSSAVLSPCGTYRYRLARWLVSGSNDPHPVVWVMLNPSTANATLDDMTVMKCRGFTAAFERARMVVVNLFALRATDPRQLLRTDVDVTGGEENLRHVRQALAEAGPAPLVVCAWGNRPSVPSPVLPLLRDAGLPLLCLGTTRAGEPRHPSRIAYSTRPEPFLVRP